MDKKFRELRKNTLIIGIANLGSKAISFILAPLYSYWMSVEQYGQMDIITTTVLLLIPLICLDIYDSTFRFASDHHYAKETIISISFIFVLPGLIIAFIVATITSFLYKNYIIAYTCVYLGLAIYENLVQQFERGRNHLEVFAVSGVLDSVCLLIFNLCFLVSMKMQLTGWIVSVILAKVVACLFLTIKSGIIPLVSFANYDNTIAKEMLVFCIPLLPNAIMWWIMNMSDRYMLSWLLGTAATGLYSVANKIPNILSIFENIFYQSWQTSTISSLSDKHKEQFFSDVLNNYLSILSIGVLMVLTVARDLTFILFSVNYRRAWVAIAPLVLGVLVHALSTNIGAIYVAVKKTKGAFFTSLLGAMVNIILNYFLIPRFGIVAAAITTLIGYLVTLMTRWFDIRKYVVLNMNLNRLLFYSVLLLIQVYLFYHPSNTSVLARILITTIAVVKERRLIIGLLRR